MTKVFQILEEEKQEAINLAEKKGANVMIEKFIKAGADTFMIMKGTGLTREQIEEIRNNILTTKQGIKSRLRFTDIYLVAILIPFSSRIKATCGKANYFYLKD